MRPTTHRSSLCEFAQRAAGTGLYVFPCWPRGKKPVVKDWEFQATRDPRQIVRWWHQRDYNIGAAVGRSGIVVIDLDQGDNEEPPAEFPDAASGLDVLTTLAERAGETIRWRTFTVATPTGGTHLYFREPTGLQLRNTAGALGWKIDTRARGGYVVAAGSRRSEGPYRIVNDEPIADLPGWLAAALTPPSAAPKALIPLPAPCRRQAYVDAIVESEANAVAAACHGQRNDILNRASFTLGRLVGGGDLDYAAAERALLNAASGHIGQHGFSTAEARRTIASGLRAGRLQPRRIGVRSQS